MSILTLWKKDEKKNNDIMQKIRKKENIIKEYQHTKGNEEKYNRFPNIKGRRKQ